MRLVPPQPSLAAPRPPANFYTAACRRPRILADRMTAATFHVEQARARVTGRYDGSGRGPGQLADPHKRTGRRRRGRSCVSSSTETKTTPKKRYVQSDAGKHTGFRAAGHFLSSLSQFLSHGPGHGQFLISRPEMNRENTGRSARYPSRSTRLLAPRLSLHADPRGTCRALLVAPRQPPCPLRSGFCGRSRLKRPARRVHWRAA